MPSEDIKNLFNRFGSRSGKYREIVREDQTTASIERWPLLSTLDVGEVRDIPGVTLAAAPAALRSAPAPAPVQQPSMAVAAPAPVAAVRPVVAAAVAPALAPAPARIEDNSLGKLFTRLAGTPPAPEPTVDAPVLPAFRRLRRS
ncbi:cellulose biosynthesis protein BcsP [Ideonella sp.]|uniref:cellulose biosynthesis protein BcsP n=1 Tax=Ideonella sp. TaxID=1929293 RepID=UPI003BB6631A